MSSRSLRAAAEPAPLAGQEPIQEEEETEHHPPSTGAHEALEAHLTYEAFLRSGSRGPEEAWGKRKVWAPKGHTHHKPKEEDVAAEAGGEEKQLSALESFMTKRKRKKGTNLNKDLMLLQYLFTNGQNGQVETRGLTRTAFKSIFSKTNEWEFAHIKQGQKERRQVQETEAGMLLDDMFAVLDKDKKGFISLNNVLQFMYRHKHKDQIEHLKKLVTAPAGHAVSDPNTVQLPPLPAERVEELREIFHTYCSDGSRSLSESEFNAALNSHWQVAPTPLELRRYFAMADTRKRGCVSERDFIEVIQNVAFVHFEDINKGVEHRYRSRSSSTSTDPTGARVHPVDAALQMLAAPKTRRKPLGQVPIIPSSAVRQGLSRSTSMNDDTVAAESTGSHLHTESSDSSGTIWDLPQRPAWRSTGGGYRMVDVCADHDVPRPHSQQQAVRPQWSRSSERKRPATSSNMRGGIGREDGLGNAGLGRGRGEWMPVQPEFSGLSKQSKVSRLTKEDVRPSVAPPPPTPGARRSGGGTTINKPARDGQIDWSSLGIVRSSALHRNN